MNWKLISILLLSITLSHCNKVYCDPVDTAEAKILAMEFYRHIRAEQRAGFFREKTEDPEFQVQKMKEAGQFPTIQKMIIQQSQAGARLYLVVFGNLDFVIVAGDHDAYPVLAYSTEHSYSEDGAPAFFWWIETEYLLHMQRILEKGIINAEHRALWDQWTSGDFSKSGETSETGPLLSSMWGQVRTNDYQCPGYNSLVPADAADCGCGKCSAGCVAVAMAQIMNYWKYPENGPYENFDWCHMPDALYKYNGSDLRPDFETERLAISDLIRDCGETASLSYCSSGCATSSTLGHATHAFRNHYAYSNAMQHQYRWLSSNWKNRLRESLNEGCPVLYGGQSSTSGHAFVCDGYQQEDFFHFNWGWNGYNNGYFFLSDEGDENEIDYDGFQEAVFFLCPQSGESSPCRRCQQHIVISNRVAGFNPYLPELPYIEWTGLPASYNYLPDYPLPYPPYSEAFLADDHPVLVYRPVDYGRIELEGVNLPDRISFSVIGYSEVLIENTETFPGAEFMAETAVCNENSPFLRQFEAAGDALSPGEEDSVKLQISPDPANDYIRISLEIPGDIKAEVEIINGNGQSLYRKEMEFGSGSPTAEIDCSFLPQGLYLCNVRGSTFARSGWFRIVR